MKKLLCIFLVYNLQALDDVFPAFQRTFILQQREAAQKSSRWYSFAKSRPSNTMLGLYGHHANLPAELKEKLLRDQLTAEFNAHTQTPRNRMGLGIIGCPVRACAFSPDGTKLAIAPQDGDCVKLVHTATRGLRHSFIRLPCIESLVFDRNSTIIGYSARDDDEFRTGAMRTAGRGGSWQWRDASEGNGMLLFSRAISQQPIEELVYPTADGTMLIAADARTGEERTRVPSTHGPIKALAALKNSDGTETLITSHEHALAIGAQTITLSHPAADSTAKHYLTVSPCQTYCALRRGAQVDVYEISTEKRCHTLSDHETIVSNIVFEPSGSSYMYACADGTFVQRSSQTGAVLLTHHVQEQRRKNILCAGIAPDLSKAFICYDKGSFTYLEDIAAYRTLAHYFSKPRPCGQALLVKLLFMYHHFVNNDQRVQKNRMKNYPWFYRNIQPLNAILMDQFVEVLQGVAPKLTLADLETTRDTMPRDVQRALAQYFGIYRRKPAA